MNMKRILFSTLAITTVGTSFLLNTNEVKAYSNKESQLAYLGSYDE